MRNQVFWGIHMGTTSAVNEKFVWLTWKMEGNLGWVLNVMRGDPYLKHTLHVFSFVTTKIAYCFCACCFWDLRRFQQIFRGLCWTLSFYYVLWRKNTIFSYIMVSQSSHIYWRSLWGFFSEEREYFPFVYCHNRSDKKDLTSMGKFITAVIYWSSYY